MSPLGRRKRSRLERSIALRRLRFERVVALREEARKTWDKIEPGVTVNIRHQRDYGDTEAGETSFTKSYLKGESWYELGLIVRAGASLCQYVAIIEYPARHLLETAANILTRIQDNEEASQS